MKLNSSTSIHSDLQKRSNFLQSKLIRQTAGIHGELIPNPNLQQYESSEVPDDAVSIKGKIQTIQEDDKNHRAKSRNQELEAQDSKRSNRSSKQPQSVQAVRSNSFSIKPSIHNQARAEEPSFGSILTHKQAHTTLDRYKDRHPKLHQEKPTVSSLHEEKQPPQTIPQKKENSLPRAPH